MDRAKILTALESQVENNVFRHTLAVEACMKGVYEYLEKEGRITDSEPAKEEWLLAGLLHDVDYGGEFKEDHPTKTQEALDKHDLSISENVMQIIKAHSPELTGVKQENLAQWSLFCLDSLTGLIMAVGYVYPSKKLEDVKLKSIKKRFHKQPKFAAGTRRGEVAQCANEDGLNIPVDIFIEICFNAMKEVSDEIGL